MLQCAPEMRQIATPLELICNNHSHFFGNFDFAIYVSILGIFPCTNSPNVSPLCILNTVPILHLRFTTQNASSNLKLFRWVFALFSPFSTILCAVFFFRICFLLFFVAWFYSFTFLPFPVFSSLQYYSSKFSLAFFSEVSAKIANFCLFLPLWDDLFYGRTFGRGCTASILNPMQHVPFCWLVPLTDRVAHTLQSYHHVDSSTIIYAYNISNCHDVHHKFPWRNDLMENINLT